MSPIQDEIITRFLQARRNQKCPQMIIGSKVFDWFWKSPLSFFWNRYHQTMHFSTVISSLVLCPLNCVFSKLCFPSWFLWVLSLQWLQIGVMLCGGQLDQEWADVVCAELCNWSLTEEVKLYIHSCSCLVGGTLHYIHISTYVALWEGGALHSTWWVGVDSITVLLL